VSGIAAARSCGAMGSYRMPRSDMSNLVGQAQLRFIPRPSKTLSLAAEKKATIVGTMRRSMTGSTISPGDHSHQDAILAYHMMIKRGADMRGDKSRDGEADQAVQHEELLREYAVLRGYRRQRE